LITGCRAAMFPISGPGGHCVACFGRQREWPREQFRKHGVNYEPAEKPKSELYRDLLPLINSTAADLLEHDKLVTQLISLERRTSRGGKDSIDHPPGGHTTTLLTRWLVLW
jgi:hypothetical protein